MKDWAMKDWDDIRYFLELGRGPSLSAAARRLKVDHTTVARRIATLERRLGLKLFDRLARGYALTEEGLRLLTDAARVAAIGREACRDKGGQDVENSVGDGTL